MQPCPRAMVIHKKTGTVQTVESPTSWFVEIGFTITRFFGLSWLIRVNICQYWINSGLIMVNIGYLIWLVVWNHGILWLSIYWECHHPNWRTPSFFRGVGQPPTSNGLIMSAIDTVQLRMNDMLRWYIDIYDKLFSKWWKIPCHQQQWFFKSTLANLPPLVLVGGTFRIIKDRYLIWYQELMEELCHFQWHLPHVFLGT